MVAQTVVHAAVFDGPAWNSSMVEKSDACAALK